MRTTSEMHVACLSHREPNRAGTTARSSPDHNFPDQLSDVCSAGLQSLGLRQLNICHHPGVLPEFRDWAACFGCCQAGASLLLVTATPTHPAALAAAATPANALSHPVSCCVGKQTPHPTMMLLALGAHKGRRGASPVCCAACVPAASKHARCSTHIGSTHHHGTPGAHLLPAAPAASVAHAARPSDVSRAHVLVKQATPIHPCCSWGRGMASDISSQRPPTPTLPAQSHYSQRKHQ